MITSEHKAAYDRDGFLILENVFAPDEIEILRASVGTEERFRNARAAKDSAGRSSRLSLSTAFTEDVWGHVSRMPRIVRGAEILLGEEVYHWHSKVMLKDPREGGAWEWHQDYGYWYNDDPAYPSLISVMLAVTDADRSNGCLRVLKGSHRCGRIDHGKIGTQTGADPARVEAIAKRLPLVDCELESGSLLFFHCNLLHSSEPNLSDRPRISYICCYNALSNPPLTKPGHGPCKPIFLVEDHLKAWT